jgi:aldehyde dehydrogenase (NAD+)
MMHMENLINGAWAAGAKSGQNVNPSNLADVIGDYAQADAAQAAQAIAAARAAFPAWSKSGIQARHDLLSAIATEIMARKAEIGRLLAREEGKTLAEGIGETARAAQVF